MAGVSLSSRRRNGDSNELELRELFGGDEAAVIISKAEDVADPREGSGDDSRNFELFPVTAGVCTVGSGGGDDDSPTSGDRWGEEG